MQALEERRLFSAVGVSLVSANSAGLGSGNSNSGINPVVGGTGPSVTPDGRYVAFVSHATDLTSTAITTAATNVYVRDRVLNTITLVSVAADGVHSGNDSSADPVITPDGRYVAFASHASNLVAGDANSHWDIFVRDLVKHVTKAVTVNAAGKPSKTSDATFGSQQPAITPDGRYVTFTSTATDLASGVKVPNNLYKNVYERDMTAGVTRLCSVNAAGTAAGNNSAYAGGYAGSYFPQVSDDGRYICFISLSSDLVANDKNGFEDIFVRDVRSSRTILVSQALAGGTANGPSGQSNSDILGQFAMTPSGRYVAFESGATNLTAIPNKDLGPNVYLRDLQAGKTTLVSVNRLGTATGKKNEYGSQHPVVTPDGRYVAFESWANDLAGNDTNGYYDADVYVRDTKTGATKMVSVNGAGTASGNDSSSSPTISDNGRYVGFVSQATDLVGGVAESPGQYNVYLRDLQAGKSTLVTAAAGGPRVGNDDSDGPQLSGDGGTLVFGSYASDLVAGDNNAAHDVFAYGITRTSGGGSGNGLGSVSGSVFNDANGNGARDAGEGRLSGWRVYVDANGDGAWQSSEPSALTDQTGTYLLSNLSPGPGKIGEVVPAGWSQTNPSGEISITVVTGQVASAGAFGNAQQSVGTGSLWGVVFHDALNYGYLRTGDALLSGWRVFLDLDADGAWESNEPNVLSGADGTYSFQNLPAGTYRVREVLQSSWRQTAPAGGYYLATVVAGQNVHAGDFGNW